MRKSVLIYLLFCGLVICTIISLVSIGMTILKSVVYEADLRNGQRLLKQQNEELERIAQLSKEYSDSFTIECARYEKLLSKLREEVSAQQVTKEEVERVLVPLQQQHASLKRQIEELEASIADKAPTLNRTLKELSVAEGIITVKRTEQEELNAQIEELKASIQKYIKEKASLLEQIASLNTEMLTISTDFPTKQAAHERIQKSVTEAQEQLAQTVGEKRALQDELTSLREIVSTTRETLSKLQSETQGLTELNAEIAAKQGQVNQLKITLAELEGKITAAKTTAEIHEAKTNNAIADFQKVLETVKKQKSLHQVADVKRQEAEAKAAEAEGRIQSLEMREIEVQKEVEQLELQLAQIQTDVKLAEKNANATIARYKKAQASATDDALDAQEKLQSVEQRIAEQARAEEAAKTRVAELEVRIKSLSKEYEALQDKLDDLR